MLGVEPDYLPNFKGLVSAGFGPQTPTGGCRGDLPHHSLCHIYDGRSYVNLMFFSPEGNPLLYMRELYYHCVLLWKRRLWESI